MIRQRPTSGMRSFKRIIKAVVEYEGHRITEAAGATAIEYGSLDDVKTSINGVSPMPMSFQLQPHERFSHIYIGHNLDQRSKIATQGFGPLWIIAHRLSKMWRSDDEAKALIFEKSEMREAKRWIAYFVSRGEDIDGICEPYGGTAADALRLLLVDEGDNDLSDDASSLMCALNIFTLAGAKSTPWSPFFAFGGRPLVCIGGETGEIDSDDSADSRPMREANAVEGGIFTWTGSFVIDDGDTVYEIGRIIHVF